MCVWTRARAPDKYGNDFETGGVRAVFSRTARAVSAFARRATRAAV